MDGTFKWYDQHGWPYNFENTENACVNVNQNHWVSLVVLSDGSLASASGDRTIKIWNTINGNLIRTLTGHTDAVLALALLLDGLFYIY